MRLFISTVAALAVCACLLAACSPQDGSAPAARSAPSAPATKGSTTAQAAKPAAGQNAEDTRRISIEETQAAVTAGTALVVDVRDEAAYKTSHIKGAKSIPLQQFDKRIGELPTDKLIITYCA